MIPQPTRFVHGQALRPETLNQILDTVRSRAVCNPLIAVSCLLFAVS